MVEKQVGLGKLGEVGGSCIHVTGVVKTARDEMRGPREPLPVDAVTTREDAAAEGPDLFKEWSVKGSELKYENEFGA